jgi:metallo-beta-lactamase class B
MRSRGLGNLTDAIVEDWEETIQKILDSYSDIRVVIPGHGSMGGEDLLRHTIDLVQKEKNATL